MTFDNSRTIIIQRIELFAASMVLLAFTILSYFTWVIKYPLLGMSETVWTIILVSIWCFFAVTPILLRHQFISYSDEGEKIIFRYFSTGIFGGKKNSVEINKKSFMGYKTESRFFGLIRTLSLSQKYKDGIAKYPPFYISALTRKEREKIFNSLNLLFPQA
jgi:hypothetical protein